MTKTWGDQFLRFKRMGMDASDAAFRADQWEDRERRSVEITEKMVGAFISAGTVADGLRAVILIDRGARLDAEEPKP